MNDDSMSSSFRCARSRDLPSKSIVQPTWYAEGTSCKSEENYPCYIDYMLSLFYRGYGQVRELYLEEDRMGDPSLVLQAPNISLSQPDIAQHLERTLALLAQHGIRKRFMVVQFSHGTYAIGGYDFVATEFRRQASTHDYFYSIELDQLIPIKPLPDGRVSFAVCTDGRYIICAGGHTFTNVALKSVYMFDTKETSWRRLPDLPAPTSGAGIAFDKQIIHLLGGFDIILHRSIVHGEYVILDVNNADQGWTRRSEIEPGRARPLLLLVPDPQNPNDMAIYSAGGYEIDAAHKPHPVGRLERYNERFERWELLDSIPDLQLEHGLSYAKNHLYVMARNERLQQYSFRTKKWTSSSSSRP